MDDAKRSASSRRAEAYRRAADKKPRNIFGLFVGIIFVGIGFFIDDIIVFGGMLIIGISLLNLYASIYAEKQLRMINNATNAPTQSRSAKPSPQIETKECTNCKKRIPVSDRFCGECGMKAS